MTLGKCKLHCIFFKLEFVCVCLIMYIYIYIYRYIDIIFIFIFAVPEDMTQGACRRFIITESETYITQTDDCSNNDINDVLCEQSIDA